MDFPLKLDQYLTQRQMEHNQLPWARYLGAIEYRVHVYVRYVFGFTPDRAQYQHQLAQVTVECLIFYARAWHSF